MVFQNFSFKGTCLIYGIPPSPPQPNFENSEKSTAVPDMAPEPAIVWCLEPPIAQFGSLILKVVIILVLLRLSSALLSWFWKLAAQELSRAIWLPACLGRLQLKSQLADDSWLYLECGFEAEL